MENIISIKKIKPASEVIPREYTWLDTKYVKAPNVLNLTKKEASSLLKGFKVEYNGNGNKIIYQDPEPDIYIKENGTIKIMLG